ncbi:MAG: hypothetical protein AAFY63_01570 [Cyanobacteria bacterium J06643_13]
MKIDIVPVVETKLPHVEKKVTDQIIKPAIVASAQPEVEVVTIEDIFAKFLQLEVGDGAASEDTIRNYLSQTKRYIDWCKDNLLAPIGFGVADEKLWSLRDFLMITVPLSMIGQ